MSRLKKAALLAGAAAVIALGAAAVPAGASTLKCTATESCGGADLAYAGHGQLSLAVLNPDSTINGGFGYNNEEVGFTFSGASNGSQDFTVFQDSTEAPGLGGVYGHGNYVAMYTPGGKLPFDLASPACVKDSPAAGEYTCSAGAGSLIPYCVSVEDTYPTVRGHVVQRWALVLRNCFAWPGTKFTVGVHGSSTVTEAEDTVTQPDLYQLWAPTEVPGPFLEFQDVALNSTHWRHGYTAGHNFVMDDRAFGPSGTWGLAYPENDQLNQKFTIIGCTQPVTVFNTAYYNCPS